MVGVVEIHGSSVVLLEDFEDFSLQEDVRSSVTEVGARNFRHDGRERWLTASRAVFRHKREKWRRVVQVVWNDLQQKRANLANPFQVCL